MTKEEAWLAWMETSKTTDTPIETDFELIKKTSWWQAFEAGWDLASVNLNGWDQAYAMGMEAGKEVARVEEREACAKVCEKERNALLWREGQTLPQGEPRLIHMANTAGHCAEAIRARGEK